MTEPKFEPYRTICSLHPCEWDHLAIYLKNVKKWRFGMSEKLKKYLVFIVFMKFLSKSITHDTMILYQIPNFTILSIFFLVFFNLEFFLWYFSQILDTLHTSMLLCDIELGFCVGDCDFITSYILRKINMRLCYS